MRLSDRSLQFLLSFSITMKARLPYRPVRCSCASKAVVSDMKKH